MKILTVSTEWGIRHGGVSVVNFELSKALQEAGNEVTCAVISQRDFELDSDGITLEKTPFGVPKIIIDREFDLIVGHGLHTGHHARFYRNEYFPGSKLAQIQHVDHIIDGQKKDGRTLEGIDEKEKLSRDLLYTADFALGVGPKLHETTENLLRQTENPTSRRIKLNPGVPSHILKSSLPEQRRKKDKNELLVVGRAEDWKLKGMDLAIEVSCQLSESYLVGKLKIRGVNNLHTHEVLDAEIDKFRNKIKIQPEFDLRAFGGAKEVLADLRSADCVLMPSRSEGFGLSGLESLAMGTPTLITANSGLALYIKAEFDSSIYNAVVVNGSSPRDWSDRVKWALSRESLETYETIRDSLRSKCTWNEAVILLLSEIQN